ncbi:MAG TPA: helix-hairpin-helix domain-containing protein [bacterium]|jgi:competence protein ComEA|nr:helix-hairpin-helix domain-containing protein [bacterium]HOZ22516.1 helix-hairpin-helix domain-containing protein [bacterium]
MLEFSLQEKRFILFLLTTFLIGCAVTYYRQIHGDAELAAWREEQLLLSQQISSLTAAPEVEAEIPATAGTQQNLVSLKQRLVAKLDLNSATAEELATLDRIGPALAARIIRYREEHGPFRTIDQLQQVKGIGPKTFSRIKERIEVD